MTLTSRKPVQFCLVLSDPCCDRSFSYLTQMVMSRVSLLSGCICILIDWDEERQKLVNYLQRSGVPVLVLLISESPSHTHNKDTQHLHLLELGKIQEAFFNANER